MKKKNIVRFLYFLSLFILLVGIGYVLVEDFSRAIETGENPFHISIPWIARRVFFEVIAFVAALIVFCISIIAIVHKKRLKTAEERKQARRERRNEKILQLNAKIEKLKSKDDD